MLRNSETRADADTMSRALRAVADAARLRLLRLCADRPTSVSELAAATSDSEPNVSRHLKQLAQAGLLRRVRRGQRVEYQPATDPGFSADLLGLLLSRLAPDDAALREARARLHAIEAGARASLRGSAADWVVTSRLGRSLRGALGSEFTRDIVGARVLVRSQHREVLEALLQDDERRPTSGGSPRVTLRAASKPEKNVLQSWLEAEGFQAEVLTSGEVRSGGIFDVCLEAPLPDELRESDQLPAGIPAYCGAWSPTIYSRRRGLRLHACARCWPTAASTVWRSHPSRPRVVMFSSHGVVCVALAPPSTPRPLSPLPPAADFSVLA
jgi:DNA-binding transcriptional ArsR family regulator